MSVSTKSNGNFEHRGAEKQPDVGARRYMQCTYVRTSLTRVTYACSLYMQQYSDFWLLVLLKKNGMVGLFRQGSLIDLRLLVAFASLQGPLSRRTRTGKCRPFWT